MSAARALVAGSGQAGDTPRWSFAPASRRRSLHRERFLTSCIPSCGTSPLGRAPTNRDYYRELLRLVIGCSFSLSRGIAHSSSIPVPTSEAAERYDRFYSTNTPRAGSEKVGAGSPKHSDRKRAAPCDGEGKLNHGGARLVTRAGQLLVVGTAMSNRGTPSCRTRQSSTQPGRSTTLEDRAFRLLRNRNLGAEESAVYESLLELHPE